MEPKMFGVRGEFITLGQLVKLVGTAATGGEAKIYIEKATIRVNGESDNRRGRKLRPGDTVELPDIGTFLLTESGPEDD
jgi:ribosome-associated protein